MDNIQRDVRLEEWKEKYKPLLAHEKSLPPEQRGIVTFLRDHLIDFGLIGEKPKHDEIELIERGAPAG
jgi:hypothetical protein